MSAYVVFTRTKTIDQNELEKYWSGVKATLKDHPIEVLVAYGNHEVLEGDPIEGIVIAKLSNVAAARGDCHFLAAGDYSTEVGSEDSPASESPQRPNRATSARG
jgi:uncharacterized protein (DUF1330 family)